jgi:hypothetical protein
MNAPKFYHIHAMPVRNVVRDLLRTCAYAKETRQYPLMRECHYEIRELLPKREVCHYDSR